MVNYFASKRLIISAFNNDAALLQVIFIYFANDQHHTDW